MKTIQEIITVVRFAQKHSYTLPAVSAADFGTSKVSASLEDFNKRAADLILSATEKQLHTLAQALSAHCKEISDLTGQDAYMQASETFAEAAGILNNTL